MARCLTCSRAASPVSINPAATARGKTARGKRPTGSRPKAANRCSGSPPSASDCSGERSTYQSFSARFAWKELFGCFLVRYDVLLYSAPLCSTIIVSFHVATLDGGGRFCFFFLEGCFFPSS